MSKMSARVPLKPWVAAFLVILLVAHGQPTSAQPESQALSSTSPSRPTSIMPRWEIGDWWLVSKSGIQMMAGRDEWSSPSQSYYQVVAEADLSGIPCVAVEKWPYPVNDHFSEAHAVFYFRKSDKRLVRQVEYFYLQGVLQPPRKTDCPAVQGCPLYGNMALPSFPLLVGAGNRMAFSPESPALLFDGQGHYLSQQTADQSLSQVPARLGSAGSVDLATSKMASDAAVEVLIVQGTDENRQHGLVAAVHQIWSYSAPWFVYEERRSGEMVVAKRWLALYGDASDCPGGSPLDPFDSIDLSPLYSSSEAGRPQDLAEAVPESITPLYDYDYEATAPEPWAGWYWPLYDGYNPNLYDSSGTWQPLKRYDAVVYSGQDKARVFEWNQGYEDPPGTVHYFRDEANWAGHCHAWAAASIVEAKPSQGSGPFNKGDFEGLLVECYDEVGSAYWRPGNASNYDNVPMSPGDFWLVLRENIGRATPRPVVMDLHTGTQYSGGKDPIWNHPVYYYYVVAWQQGPSTWWCEAGILYKLDTGIAPGQSGLLPEHRAAVIYEFTADVEDGHPVAGSGVWLFSTLADSSQTGYPDWAWFPDISNHRPQNEYVTCDMVKRLQSRRLTSISVSGPSSVDENSYADYEATAHFSDGYSASVTSSASWSENASAAYIDSSVAGRVRTSSVPSDRSVTVTATYTYNPVTKSGSKAVTIVCLDDDGDGVGNDQDLCPDTPTCATSIDADGCAIDSDGDGAFDGCPPAAQEIQGCCGSSGPVSPLGLAVGMLLLSRFTGYRSVRRRR